MNSCLPLEVEVQPAPGPSPMEDPVLHLRVPLPHCSDPCLNQEELAQSQVAKILHLQAEESGP